MSHMHKLSKEENERELCPHNSVFKKRHTQWKINECIVGVNLSEPHAAKLRVESDHQGQQLDREKSG